MKAYGLINRIMQLDYSSGGVLPSYDGQTECAATASSAALQLAGGWEALGGRFHCFCSRNNHSPITAVKGNRMAKQKDKMPSYLQQRLELPLLPVTSDSRRVSQAPEVLFSIRRVHLARRRAEDRRYSRGRQAPAGCASTFPSHSSVLPGPKG